LLVQEIVVAGGILCLPLAERLHDLRLHAQTHGSLTEEADSWWHTAPKRSQPEIRKSNVTKLRRWKECLHSNTAARVYMTKQQAPQFYMSFIWCTNYMMLHSLKVWPYPPSPASLHSRSGFYLILFSPTICANFRLVCEWKCIHFTRLSRSSRVKLTAVSTDHNNM
jgi:hypothetical protein